MPVKYAPPLAFHGLRHTFAAEKYKELLQAVDGLVGGHIVRHKQFMAPLGACQLTPQRNGDLLVDGDGADLAALALDGDGVLPKGLLCRGGVDAETLVDAEPSVTG